MLKYPDHLLPRSIYRIMAQCDVLSQKNLMLIRHIESKDMLKIANSATLHPDCIKIQSDHLRDLSTNLLGMFGIDDIYYGIREGYRSCYCDLWQEGIDGLAPATNEYFKDEKRGYYFIPVDKLLNFSSEGDRKYRFMIYHTPTKCNFWHVSIKVLNEKEQEVSRLGASAKRKIWKSAKDFLVMNIIVIAKEVSFSSIEKSSYTLPKR